MKPDTALPRRAAAALVTVCVVAGSLASCRDVLIGERVDVAARICALLQDCYGDQYSCEAIEADLRNASPAVRAQFLGDFDVEACLASCPGARACLDRAPFCSASGSCQYDNDCCSWSTGEAACGEGPTAGQCCKPNGVACGEGDLCCYAHCDKGTCGGYSCKLVSESCEKDTDCCSLFCQEKLCATKTCSFLGEPCETVVDCCPVDFATSEGVTLECLDEQCAVVGELPCFSQGEMCTVGGSECCVDLGLSCIPFAGEQGFCGSAECPGFGQECTVEGTCCEGFVCDLSGFCIEASVCFDEGEFCDSPIDCCGTLDCVGGLCGESGCVASDCHDVCDEGPPMKGCDDDPQFGDCIAAIIDADPFCGCTWWDFTCTFEVGQYCDDACF